MADDAQKLATDLGVVSYVLSLIDQLTAAKALMDKPGGTTLADLAALRTYHESERDRIGKLIDEMPGTPNDGKQLI